MGKCLVGTKAFIIPHKGTHHLDCAELPNPETPVVALGMGTFSGKVSALDSGSREAETWRMGCVRHGTRAPADPPLQIFLLESFPFSSL